MNIFLSTFGMNAEIIKESLGIFENEDCAGNYYIQKDEKTREAVREARKILKRNQIERLDELWLLATDQGGLQKLFGEIENWNHERQIVQSVRIFVLKNMPDIASKNQADAFHNMAMKVAAFAGSKVRNSGGKLLISLAGGRKTMSSDLQDAAYSFGFDALLHILSSGDSIIPVIVAENIPGNESLNDLTENLAFRFDERKFGKWNYFDDRNLNCLDAVRERLEESRCFYSTLYRSDKAEDSREMFHALYTLSAAMRDKLKNCKIGVSRKTEDLELSILRTLPKSDLHCHLGGVLRTAELVEVAETLKDDIVAEKERNEKFAGWIEELDVEHFENPCLNAYGNSERNWRGWKNWRRDVLKKTNAPESLIIPAFLLKFKGREKRLDEVLYGLKKNERFFCATAKENKNAAGELSLAEYESYGNLQGSALLKSEKTLRKTVQVLLRKSREENLKYLELRCSPINYCTEKLTAKQVAVSILEELDKEKEIASSVLFIASRPSLENKSSKETMAKYNSLIRELGSDPKYGELFNRYFRGFDLAGDERMGTPEEALEIFEKPLKSCVNITIHAGETMDVNNIWQAVYKLNAERIGHGLTLENNEELCNKFLERRIGIEMCPSSNYQIVGFRDNYFREQWERENLGEYPLKKYLDKELRVCLNTDDPGISRTDITREYLKAGRLTKGGLSLWDILLLCYNGFSLAFYPYKEKKEMLSRINKLVYEWIKNQNLNIDKLLEAQNESVLYVSRADLSASFDLRKQTFLMTADQLNALPFSYAPRSELEGDSSKKQMIPYALLFDANGNILSYSRNGSEERLRRRRSIGFGGHVNDKDKGNSLLEILRFGLLRELNEEIGLQISEKSLKFLGVINEEISEVGLSHTGVVFNVEFLSGNFSFDGEIQNPRWEKCENVKEKDFELWSILALKLAKRFDEK